MGRKLMISAIRKAVSKQVGKSSLLMYEFTDKLVLFDLERCRQTWSLLGFPDGCVCTETIRGDEKKGPCKICSILDFEKGPVIQSARTSSARY
jgi:hypothetical protein